MKQLYNIAYIFSFICILLSTSCRDDEMVYLSEQEQITPPVSNSKMMGFYLLNEGNMGMNKATIDYFEYPTGLYYRDIYSENNPGVVKELGDVGNDLQVYGNKLYAVINNSNKIEIMDARSAKRITEITVPNCRYLAFHAGKAYVSSYAANISVDPNAQIGFVAEIDTTTLTLTRKVNVGYQPEEMVVHNGKLYVANSGGYRAPNYDKTVSVIDLNTFEEIKKIDVGINLHRMVIDKRGYIYVNSRGNLSTIPSKLYVIDSKTDAVTDELDIPVTNMRLSGDSLYFFNAPDNKNATYSILDTRYKKIVSNNFISDGSERQIMLPYGLGINPDTKEIYLTDVQNFVVTGYIYCFTPEGKLKWKTQAGNIPAHIAFVPKNR